MPTTVPVERIIRSSSNLHRSTQELSIQAAELDAALTRDDTARFQHALNAQQRVRIGAIVALAVSTILIRSGSPVVIAAAVLLAGIYVVTLLRSAAAAGQYEARLPRLTAVVASADAIAVTGMCAIAAAGGATDTLVWILVVGGVGAPGMAFAFGNSAAMLYLGLFAAGYIGTGLLYFGLHIGAVTSMASVVTVVLWASGVWLLIRHFSGLRQRLDWLRTYAKLAEVGDLGTADMIPTTSGPDDFTLLARSFEAVHSRLYEQIGSDPLTGCANRRGLEKALLGVCRLARRRDGVVAVAAIDMDFFKQINDTFGHPEGDRVLRQMATIMMNTARDTDTVARVGGDEFVIILPDSDWRGARSFAERLRDRVRETAFGPPGSGIKVTISIGVAVGEGKSQLEPDRLLAEADQALYEAKANGRDRVSAASGTRTSGAL